VWRVLRRVGLNTRAKRLALIARHRDPYERRPDLAPPERHIDASQPGETVQLDCVYVGRLSETKGTVWQYTAIDVASSFCWAELHSSERNPRARHTRDLLHRVAAELAAAGWRLREVTTDAPTPGASPKDACPPTSSTAHARPAPDDDHLKPQLRVRTT
jgi:Integrase core domain